MNRFSSSMQTKTHGSSYPSSFYKLLYFFHAETAATGVHSPSLDFSMASITALLHTKNDALRLGRCLETLYACDNILIVDHDSRDGTRRIAREYGARIIEAGPRGPMEHRLGLNSSGWILALGPHESLTESLAASLFEWKEKCTTDGEMDSNVQRMPDRSSAFTIPAFSVFVREEKGEGWVDLPTAQTRLVPANWKHWNGNMPLPRSSAIVLPGPLLRFTFP